MAPRTTPPSLAGLLALIAAVQSARAAGVNGCDDPECFCHTTDGHDVPTAYCVHVPVTCAVEGCTRSFQPAVLVPSRQTIWMAAPQVLGLLAAIGWQVPDWADTTRLQVICPDHDSGDRAKVDAEPEQPDTTDAVTSAAPQTQRDVLLETLRQVLKPATTFDATVEIDEDLIADALNSALNRRG